MEKEEEKKVEELKAEQTKLLEELKEKGWKPEDTPEFKGLLSDKTSETKRRQSLEEDNQRLNEQLDLLIKEKGTSPSEEDELKGKSDEDYITVGDAKKLLKGAMDEGKTVEAKKQQATLQNKLATSEEKAKAELTVEKVGKGLDYSSVLEGYKRMIAKNPGRQQAVFNSDDPAMEAYRIGLRDPEIAKLVDAKKNAKLLDDLTKKGGGTPKVSGGGGISLEEKSYEELLAMEKTDLEKSLRADEEGRK